MSKAVYAVRDVESTGIDLFARINGKWVALDLKTGKSIIVGTDWPLYLTPTS